MTLRSASPEDLRFIVALEQQFCELGFTGADDLQTHERRLADPDCMYLVVESGGVPAGYVILRGLRSANDCVELKRIVIAEPGRGLGRQVMEAVPRKVFCDFSAHRLWLDVFEHNARARHVYRSVGFVEEGTLRECVKHRGQYSSLVLMSILEHEYRELASSFTGYFPCPKNPRIVPPGRVS